MMYIIVSNSSNLFLVELEISITNHSYANYIDYMITLVYTNWVKPIPPTKVVHCGWLRETNISAGSKALFYQSAESDSVYGTASVYFSDSGSGLLFGKLAR